MEGSVAFFTRSGYTTSPGHSTLACAGDQLFTWDAFDGLKTALLAMLSSGFAGVSLRACSDRVRPSVSLCAPVCFPAVSLDVRVCGACLVCIWLRLCVSACVRVVASVCI